MIEAELHILRESLDLLILKALTWGPKHGYAVAEWIEQATGTVLLIDEGTLYPALHRLARRKLVETEWGVSDNNRKAKFYELTKAGQKQARRATADWEQTTEILSRFLTPAEEA